MEKELGKWDNLVVGHSHDEIEKRERAQAILKSRHQMGLSGQEEVDIVKNLHERDQSGNLRLGNTF